MLKDTGRTLSVVFLAVCAGLCGCDDRLEEQVAVWSERLTDPLRQIAAGESPWEKLQELVHGSGLTLPETAEEPEEIVSTEKMTVQLFFAGTDGAGLVEETRQIPKVPGIARATVEALLAGPEEENAVALFPAGTRLQGITITPEGVCKLDFSPEIRQLPAEQEEMATLAIMKTLAQFPGVQTVQFMIDGFSVNSLTGRSTFDVQ